MDKDRFQKVYSQGLVNVAEILVDTQTGVGGRRPGAFLSARPQTEESENSLTTAGKSHIIHI